MFKMFVASIAVLLLSTIPAAGQPAKPVPYEPRNDLERLHLSMRAGQADVRDFMRGLLHGPLCAGIVDSKPGEAGGNPLDNMTLVVADFGKGEPSLVLFTDKSRVKEITGKEPICGPGDAMLDMAQGPVIINPGYSVAIPLEPDAVKTLLAMRGAKVPGKAGVMRGPGGVLDLKAPASPPAGLVPKLKAALAAEPQVIGAELSEGTWSVSKEKTWIVAIHISGGEISPLTDRVLAAVKGIDKGLPLEIMVSRNPAALGGEGLVLK